MRHTMIHTKLRKKKEKAQFKILLCKKYRLEKYNAQNRILFGVCVCGVCVFT